MKMKMKKWLIVIMVLILLVLSGCSQKLDGTYVMQMNSDSDAIIEIKFEGNNYTEKLIIKDLQINRSGTYKIEDDILTLIFEEGEMIDKGNHTKIDQEIPENEMKIILMTDTRMKLDPLEKDSGPNIEYVKK